MTDLAGVTTNCPFIRDAGVKNKGRYYDFIFVSTCASPACFKHILIACPFLLVHMLCCCVVDPPRKLEKYTTHREGKSIHQLKCGRPSGLLCLSLQEFLLVYAEQALLISSQTETEIGPQPPQAPLLFL